MKTFLFFNSYNLINFMSYTFKSHADSSLKIKRLPDRFKMQRRIEPAFLKLSYI